MKIQELRLAAVGPFTDLTLDLSGGKHGLHMIYGPNEAGKSSALRAIRYLLYGFPMRLSDDFVHTYQKLRVGGRLSNDRGEELQITRRKANQKSLRDGPDEQEVGEDILRAFLGNAGEDLFSRSFGIDHDTLVQGGQEIVRGEGDLGQMLFSGSGIVHLRDLETKLDEELATLFASRGQKPRINAQLRELNDARKRVRKHQLRPAEWERHYTSLQDALKHKQRLEVDRNDKRRQRDRLSRFHTALARISECLELQETSEQMQDVILLPADFNSRREEVLRELSIAESTCSTAAKEIEHRQKQLARIEVPQDLLDSGPRMDSLEKSLHRYHDAQTDRPSVAAGFESHEAEAQSVLRELGEGIQLDQADSLLLPAPERARVQRLVAEYGKLAKAAEDGNRSLAESAVELGDRQRELEDTAIPLDSRSLQRSVAATLKLGNIDERLADLHQSIASECEEADRELGRLPVYSGTLEELENLEVPVPETVEHFADDIREAEEAVQAIDGQIQQASQEAQTHERSLDELRADQDVPTEEQLKELRIRRDQAWRLIRRSGESDGEDDSEVNSLLVAIDATDKVLEDAYEDLVSCADTVSDRLRHEADRVARHGQLHAELARARVTVTDLLQERDRREERRRNVTEDWQGLWRELGIEPLTPREMRSWLQRHGELIGRARTVRRLRLDEAEASQSLEDGKQLLANELQAAGQCVEPSQKSLDEMLQLAQEASETLQDMAGKQRETEREVKRLQKEDQRARREQSESEKRLSNWRDEWKTAIANLPKVSAEQPNEANQVLELLHQLSLKLNNADQQRRRLAAIDAFRNQFQQQVSEIAQATGLDLTNDQSVDRVATDILARYREAFEQDKERKRLLGELGQRQSNLENATAAVTALQSQLDQLCQEAGCRSSDDLLAAWNHSERKQQVSNRLEQLRQELRAFCAGMPLQEFIAEAQCQDADALPAQIEQLEHEIGEMDRVLVDEIGQTIGREEETLNHMDSSGHAAEAEETARDILAGLARDAGEYAVLRVAQVALRRSIERYRERHQGPILQTASEVFARLTAGSFQGLKADYDPSGNAALMGIRSGTGEAIPVVGMSDGTADQLYFALRYSWVTNYLDSHESLPFIVDDILIRFDNNRACETLKELAELSNRTQVLFFTHHRHLVDFAEKTLPADVLFVSELSTS